MLVKEFAQLAKEDLKITVTDNRLTYDLDENLYTCPLDNYVVKCVNIEEDKLVIICEQLVSNNLNVIEYISCLYFDDLVKVIDGHKVVCEGYPLELRTNSSNNILHSSIKHITHESGDTYGNTINIYI